MLEHPKQDAIFEPYRINYRSEEVEISDKKILLFKMHPFIRVVLYKDNVVSRFLAHDPECVRSLDS